MSYTRAQVELLRLEAMRPTPRPNDRTLPARRLIEFRCAKAGHLLGVIYASTAGPLFVSTADELTDDAEGRRASIEDTRKIVESLRSRLTASHASAMKRLAWEPSPRLPLLAEPGSEAPAPTSCRCGGGPLLTQDSLKWALGHTNGADAVVFGVSLAGISGAGDTL